MVESTPVIVAALRTPQGKQNGFFKNVPSIELAIPLVDEILSSTSLEGGQIDDTIWGCAKQIAEQGHNFARVLTLCSDLGETVPGTTVDRLCGSSAQALISASDSIRVGDRDAVVVGGVESMTRVQRSHEMAEIYPKLDERYDVDELQMGATAETVARRYDISRAAQDEYALRSHRRAAEATDSGRFDDEIVAVETDDGVVSEDEGIRRETSIEALGNLPSAFKHSGSVTAGNSSQVSDGAAAVLVTSRRFAEEHNLDVLAEVGHHFAVGVDPTIMGVGPVPATRGLMDLGGTTIDDYGLVELNEAFASQTLYCRNELGVDPGKFNVNGGAIAIGHPLGATGVRLPVTLVHEMERRNVDRGLATECVGYGQGVSIEFLGN